MLILRTTLTPTLETWLRESHDDDERPLRVAQVGVDVLVCRADYSEPSDGEQLEVAARCAAHAIDD